MINIRLLKMATKETMSFSEYKKTLKNLALPNCS